MTAPTRIVDRLRQPEYTGENRCIPCTTVNLLIAVALAAGAALVHVAAGAAVLLVSVAAIALRGYLVPGTPTLTKRYFPEWLLAKFDKAPEPGTVAVDAGYESTPDEPTDAGEPSGDPETVLVESGVVEPCADADDLCLDDEVRESFRARVERLRDGDRSEQVASLLEVDPDDVAVSTAQNAVVVRVEGRVAGRWESDAALLADLAGTEVLADRVPNWEAFDIETRSRIAGGLRAFVERCPTCGGAISVDERTVESCCRSHEVYAVTCEECEARILEVTQ